MALPKVVIVGRPNVGKSSLFNWMAGQRIAIVDPTAGVTRDRVSYAVEHEDRRFELVDTGGMGIEDPDGLTAHVERQIQTAIEEANLVLFVIDAQTGIAGLDELVIKRLRGIDKPMFCVANKCDNPKLRMQAVAEFSGFGKELVCVSTTANSGKEELLTAILARLSQDMEDEPEEAVMKLAVVGKRNAGKSTFINHLAQAERMIVSEVPGTTRDSVDVRFEHNGRAFIAIDTAGVRRIRSLANSIEFYGYSRAQRTVRRADVVLYFIDASDPMSKVDKKLVHYVAEQYKPCVFVVNKWDLLRPMPTGRFDEYLNQLFPMMRHVPRVFITATSGRNVKSLVDLAQSLFNQANTRVPTADLNRVLLEAVERNRPPLRENKTARIFYATQVSVAPPTVVLFCNDPKLISESYRRYLLNVFRDELPFAEVPIKLHLRRRDSHLPRPASEEMPSETQAPMLADSDDSTFPVDE